MPQNAHPVLFQSPFISNYDSIWLRVRNARCQRRPVSAPRSSTIGRSSTYPLALSISEQTDSTARSFSFGLMKALVAATLTLTRCSVHEAAAISGGGLGYSGSRLSGQDMSRGQYVNEDFSGTFCRGTVFRESNFTGARFFKADLAEADFTNAVLSGASLEQAVLRDTIFRNAVLTGTYWTESVLQAADIQNTDWSDALLLPFVQSKLCSRSDAQGINPSTGASTRTSLMCPES